MMALVEPESLHEPEQVYLARKLHDARAVEEFLTGAGVDYEVQVEAYAHGFLFGSIRHGAAFYVAGAAAEECRRRLIDAGFERGVVQHHPDDSE